MDHDLIKKLVEERNALAAELTKGMAPDRRSELHPNAAELTRRIDALDAEIRTLRGTQ